MESIKNEVITQSAAKAEINIALVKANLSVQALQNEADSLVINEDNQQQIANFIAKLKKIDDVIISEHKELKAPYLEAGRACDAAKNDYLSITESIRAPIKSKYTILCNDISERQRLAQLEENRKKEMVKGIFNNLIDFSTKIANCTTYEQLLSVESVINLEKSDSRKNKYGEFHAKAISQYDDVLKPIIKNQKEKIRKAAELEKYIKAAEYIDDIEKLEALSVEKQKIDEQINWNKINVQQNAVNVDVIQDIPVAEEIFPEIKYRKTYYIELIDEKEALKKAKDCLIITINKDVANNVLKTLKDTGAFKNQSEIIVNGIKYSEIKNYK